MTAVLERKETRQTRTSGKPPRGAGRLFDGWLVTGFTGLILFIFLLPLGYMVITSLKSEQMITNLQAPILPKSPATFEYEGKMLDIYTVPMPDGSERELALYEPRRQISQFVDPADPDAGTIEWEGNWRQLEPAYGLDPQWSNYSRAWNLMDFPLLLRNTFVIAGFGTLGAVGSSILVAYGLARFRVPFGRTIMVVLIATIILPRFVTLVPTYAVFVRIGWIGTWLPLIVPHFFANAFNVFLLRQYFLTIPKELDEAATIDGAGPLRILTSVILPQSWAVIVAVSVFHIVYTWNLYFEPLLYLSSKPELQPIATGLAAFNSIYGSSPELVQAATLMTLIIPMAVFFMAQRAFMRGIIITGVEK